MNHQHLLLAARLVDELDGQRRREQQARSEGWRDGLALGDAAGYARRCREEMAEANARAKQVKDWQDGLLPAEADRFKVNNTPCDVPHASRCSRCHRARTVARRGGDYLGGPVPWDAPRKASA